MMKNTENYKLLPAKTSQKVLKCLDVSWKSFFNSISDWKRYPKKYNGKPKPPGYLPRNGEYVLTFTNQSCRIRNGSLIFPKKSKIKEVDIRDCIENLKEVRIVPNGVGYWLNILYSRPKVPMNLDKTRAISIDFGVRNLVTIADNIGGHPIVVKGGVIKSINQFYNKRKALLRSIYDKQGLKHTPKRLKKLSWNRTNKIRDFMHKVSRWIVNYCIENNIGTIVIGYNDEWKEGVKLGKVNNQTFSFIPFDILIKQIQYKADEIGIDARITNESYTSKSSFLDGEFPEYHNVYAGRRIKRGIFKSSKDIYINADVNACYNLLNKANAILNGARNLAVDGIEGVGLHPRRCNLFTTSKGGH